MPCLHLMLFVGKVSWEVLHKSLELKYLYHSLSLLFSVSVISSSLFSGIDQIHQTNNSINLLVPDYRCIVCHFDLPYSGIHKLMIWAGG